MHKQFKVPVKLLLIAAIAVLSLLMVSGLALAETRRSSDGDDRFEVIEASGSSAYFSILDEGDCDDTDETVLSRLHGLRTGAASPNTYR